MSRQYTAMKVYPRDFKFLKSRGEVQLRVVNNATNQSNVENMRLNVYICIKILKYYYYRKPEKLPELRSEEMRKVVEERIKLARSAAPQGSSDLLVRQPQLVSWGTKKPFNKEDLVAKLVGYKPTMGRKQDEACMKKYLDKIMVNGLQDPKIGARSEKIL